MIRLLSVLACVLIMSAVVSAAPIAVVNHSFEDAGLAAGGWTDATPSGWQESVPGSNGSFSEAITGFAADGTQHQGINGLQTTINGGILPAGSFEYSVWQDLGVPLQPNTEYTLTVAIGNRNASFTIPDSVSVFALQAGGADVLSDTFDASTIPESTFVDQSLTYVTNSSPPAGNLGIRLANLDLGLVAGGAAINARSHFDNIRLDAVAIPEPTGLALVAIAFGFIGCIRRRVRN
jgi:hypothetical protein